MKHFVFLLQTSVLIISILFSLSSCEKKKEYAVCSPICDNYDTLAQYISAKINGIDYYSDDAALYKINGNEVLDYCTFSVGAELNTDSSISIFFKGDTSITNHSFLDNVEYYNIGEVNFFNKVNINLSKKFTTTSYKNGEGEKRGEIIISSIKDCRMTGTFNFKAFDSNSNDSVIVSDGKFSVRLY